MNLSLLKLLVRYSDDYGCVDLSKVKSLYQGSSSLSSELQNLVSNRSQIHDQASASYASLIVCGSLSASNSPSKLQYCAICLERSSSVPFPLLLFVSITCITFALSVPFGLTVFFLIFHVFSPRFLLSCFLGFHVHCVPGSQKL